MLSEIKKEKHVFQTEIVWFFIGKEDQEIYWMY